MALTFGQKKIKEILQEAKKAGKTLSPEKL